jgi:hypothetical protein
MWETENIGTVEQKRRKDSTNKQIKSKGTTKLLSIGKKNIGTVEPNMTRLA